MLHIDNHPPSSVLPFALTPRPIKVIQVILIKNVFQCSGISDELRHLPFFHCIPLEPRKGTTIHVHIGVHVVVIVVVAENINFNFKAFFYVQLHLLIIVIIDSTKPKTIEVAFANMK